MLSYGLMREKILFKNSLNSYENIEDYCFNSDIYYNTLSADNERKLIELSTSYRSVLSDLMKFTDDFDSPDFCLAVVSNSMDDVEMELHNAKQIVTHDQKV